MHPPDRLTVPTCIGCGAMSQFGTCDTGCSEHKLELVRAVAHDSLIATACGARARAEAFRAIVARVTQDHSVSGELDRVYRSLQRDARAALRKYPDVDRSSIDPERGAEPALTWWCPGCGGIDAPQPCVGICIWRSVDWVNRDIYEQQHERTLFERERERSLRQCLRRLASVTPRPGQWERNWRLLGAEARKALEPPAITA